MSATMVMLVSVLMYVLLRWSKNEKAVTIGGVVAGAFVVGVIALADRGRTAVVAEGFAWLFFTVVAYKFTPVATGLVKTYAPAAKSNVTSTLKPGSDTGSNTV
jgi:hypothetical protein